MNKTTTTVKMDHNRRLSRQTETGWEPFAVSDPVPGFPADDPAFDPDNPPTAPEDFRRMKRVPRIRSMRRALMLTQQEFAERYHIPIGTLRDWEQGRSEPDAPARAYLDVIAADPEGVVRALQEKRKARTA